MIECQWGEQGLQSIADTSDVIVIVDVLSFCTCVDIAVSRGAAVMAHKWKQPADVPGAIVAGARGKSQYSLSPASLLHLPAGRRLVLPSPNGATLSTIVQDRPVLAGCLRNAQAVATAAAKLGQRISVIAAGERWPDGSIRFAIEDWLGAGAIIQHLNGTRSPDAQLAQAAFASVASRMFEVISAGPSGVELIDRGFKEDVELACQVDCSSQTPVIKNGEFVSP